ncbi:MAG: peptidoglycan-binding domain-containing protein [Acidobacteriota bacterium]|nr:peptidoglycan-binding domain-containing protein [Acidobacteriota bacterium]
MERAVRMIFRNIMFDTWIEVSGGMSNLRRDITNLARRLGNLNGADPGDLKITEQAGLLNVHCEDISADVDTVSAERGCAVFSILPGRIPRFSRDAGRIGATHHWKEPENDRRQQNRNENPRFDTNHTAKRPTETDDEGPLFGSTGPVGNPPDQDDAGPLFESTPPQTWKEDAPEPLFGPDAIPQLEPPEPETEGLVTTAPAHWREEEPTSWEAEDTQPNPSIAHPRVFRLFFKDHGDHRPADLRYRLEMGGVSWEGRLDDRGSLELTVSPDETEARLTIFLSDEPGHALSRSLVFAPLPEAETIPGIRARLHGLGYDTGSLNDRFDARLAEALRQFQQHKGLTDQDGALDEPTRTAVTALFENGGKPTF